MVLGGLVSYPNSLCLRFTPPSKDIYIAAGNYEEMAKYVIKSLISCQLYTQLFFQTFYKIRWRDVLLFHVTKYRPLHHHQHLMNSYSSTNTNHITSEVEKREETENKISQNHSSNNNNRCNIQLNEEKSYPKYDQIDYALRVDNSNKCLKINEQKMLQVNEMDEEEDPDEEDENEDDDEEQMSRDKSSSPENNNNNSNGNSGSNGSNGNNSRRLSYKEDDLLRKQRLKENLSQLLIEYKHEEEAQMKRLHTTQSNSNLISNKSRNSISINQKPSRASLDSCYPSSSSLPSSTNKPSAFHSVAAPCSAFKPVINNSTNKPSTVQSSSMNVNNANGLLESSSSSTSSTSSSCSSTCSSSSSPPKLRQLQPQTHTSDDYKNPCLISPRSKQQIDYHAESISTPTNEIIDLTQKKSAPMSLSSSLLSVKKAKQTTNNSNNVLNANVSGYLWKLNATSSYEKYWFSLNTSLCTLAYWLDKYDQDLGKNPLNKYELNKCTQLNNLTSSTSSISELTEFKLSFHQNQSSIQLKASNKENKSSWFEALKHTIENLSNVCMKCKPKLVVNPMPSSSSSMTNNNIQQPQQIQIQNIGQQVSAQSAIPSPVVQSVLVDSPNSFKSKSKSSISSCTSSSTTSSDFEQLKMQYEKLLKENNEISSKFKLLEQIHLDTINEYDKQQSRLYNQIEDMHLKTNKSDHELENLTKRYNQMKSSYESSLSQISSLNEQLSKCENNLKKHKEKELEYLKQEAKMLKKQKEKEAEYDEQVKKKCEKLESELDEAHERISDLSLQLKEKKLQDFTDDLGKVLMSKEEVITQLEKQLKDKEKQLAMFTESHEKLKNHGELIKTLESALNEALIDKEKVQNELKNLQEYTRNDMDTLQEEIKTLEYKFVHAQRQAQDYQNIIEDTDISITNLINFLTQTLAQCSSSMSYPTFNDSCIQNRLKKSQAYVHVMITQLLSIKNEQIEQLSKRMNDMQVDMNEMNKENVELNNHIYSIDVYMREKEAQCEHLQKEKEDLLVKLSNSAIQQQQQQDKIDEANKNEYQAFIDHFKETLLSNTKTPRDFVNYLLTICNSLLMLNEKREQAQIESNNDDDQNENESDLFASIDLQKLIELSSKQSDKKAVIDLKCFRRSLNRDLNETCTRFQNMLDSFELKQFNTQIVSYMAEQLIHKAALNGHLKFACELLKKKCDANNQSPSAPGSANSSNVSSASKSLTPFTVNQQQDERLFKLASEILLSDEDSLRKLSAQLLNEAQHLNQLNCVLNTLKKIRWKYLKSIDANDEYSTRVNDQSSADEAELNEDDSNTDSSQTQLNYILAVIKDIFMQHKLQVNEQLSEVHKLMCISSDDDLLAHLQNQNNQLQQEVIKLREQVNNHDESKLSSAITSMQQGNRSHGNNVIQLRKFGSLNKIELPKSSQNNSNTSNSSEKLVSNQQASHANSFQFNKSQHHHHHHHHHILSDLLSQDDTMC